MKKSRKRSLAVAERAKSRRYKEEESEHSYDSTSSADKNSSLSAEDLSSDNEDQKTESDAELSFACYNMDKRDFHSIRQFLQNSFGGGLIPYGKSQLCRIDTQGLTEIIVDILSEYVGTTAKNTEDDDPLAFTAILPINLDDNLEGVKKYHIDVLKETISTLRHTARSSKNLSKQKLISFNAILDEKRVALVIHERFMNLPAEVAAPLYKQLIDDLPAAIEEEPHLFDTEYVLIPMPIFREMKSQLDCPLKDNNLTKVQEDDDEGTEHSSGDYQYYYGECELLENEAELYWDCRIRTPHETSDSRRAFGDRGVDPARRIFLLKMNSFRSFVAQCQSILDHNQ